MLVNLALMPMIAVCGGMVGSCMFSCCDSSRCCSGGCGTIGCLPPVEVMVLFFRQSMVELVALLSVVELVALFSVVALGAVGSLVFAVSPGMAVDAVCGANMWQDCQWCLCWQYMQ